MSGYFDIMTFGMGPINLKDVTGATEHFAGTVVDTTKVLQTSAAAAKGINWGSDKGMYRIKVMCDIKVQQKITYTEPGLKGDTATNTLKPATVESGATVRVPLFINEGETIEIDTRDGSYVGRVKA